MADFACRERPRVSLCARAACGCFLDRKKEAKTCKSISPFFMQNIGFMRSLGWS
jgi:hypothetical protein